MKRFIVMVLMLLATPALAQQQDPDPAVMKKLIGSVQAQRNQALDLQAVVEARAGVMADDLAKAREQIKALEAQTVALKDELAKARGGAKPE